MLSFRVPLLKRNSFSEARGPDISKTQARRPGPAGRGKPGDTTGVRELLAAIPKTEIHLHLEGLASVRTVWHLVQRNRISIPGIDSEDDIRRRFRVRSLPQFIDLFLNVIQNSFRTEDDVRLLFDDARAYLRRNAIVYAELHFAPSMFLRIGHRFDRLMAVLDAGAADLARDGLTVRFLIDVSRTFGVANAMQNLDLTLANRIPAVVGIGLGGQESTGPAREFVSVFEKARRAGLRLVAHAGEAVGPESIRDAVMILGAERIGHGVSAALDPSVVDLLAERRVPIEMCPSSNIFTGHYATTLEEHPIGPFFRRGLRVTVNTDDPTIFGVELLDEYLGLVEKGIFTPDETLKLLQNNLYATFLPGAQQDRLWADACRIMEAKGHAAPA